MRSGCMENTFDQRIIFHISDFSIQIFQVAAFRGEIK